MNEMNEIIKRFPPDKCMLFRNPSLPGELADEIYVFDIDDGFIRFDETWFKDQVVGCLLKAGVKVVTESELPNDPHPLLVYMDQLKSEGVSDAEYSRLIKEFLNNLRAQRKKERGF